MGRTIGLPISGEAKRKSNHIYAWENRGPWTELFAYVQYLDPVTRNCKGDIESRRLSGFMGSTGFC